MKMETNLSQRACYLGRETQLAIMDDEWALCPVSNGRDAKNFDCPELGEDHFTEPQRGPDLGTNMEMKALAPFEKSFPIWWPQFYFQ